MSGAKFIVTDMSGTASYVTVRKETTSSYDGDEEEDEEEEDIARELAQLN